MSNELTPYDGGTLENLSSRSEEQLMNIACDMLKWCDHTCRGMNERIRASLAKVDAMDKMAELYRFQREKKTYQSTP